MAEQNKCTVLVVDDTETNIDILSEALDDLYEVSVAMNGEDALDAVQNDPPDIILLDIQMPGMDGYEVCQRLKRNKKNKDIPVIFVSALGVTTDKTKGFQSGAVDYITKPFQIPEVKARIKTHLSLRFANMMLARQNTILEEKVEERTSGIKLLNSRLKLSLLNSVRMMVNMLEGSNPFLAEHSKRMAYIALETGKKMGLSKRELFDLEIATLLHDIGTMSLPEELLNTPFKVWEDKLLTTTMNKLNEEKRGLIMQHPVFAQNILAPSEDMKNAGTIIRHHLEHFDGSGFPDGLSGDAIPLGSQILGAVNAFDEIKWRRRFTGEQFASDKMAEDFAIHSLDKLGKTHFDQEVIRVVTNVVDAIALKNETEIDAFIADLQSGMRLVEHVSTTDGKLLLAKNTQINAEHIEKLKAFRKANLINKTIRVYKFIR